MRRLDEEEDDEVRMKTRIKIKHNPQSPRSKPNKID